MRVRRRPGGAREVGPGHGLSDRAAMPQQGGQTGIQALFGLGGDAVSAPPHTGLRLHVWLLCCRLARSPPPYCVYADSSERSRREYLVARKTRVAGVGRSYRTNE